MYGKFYIYKQQVSYDAGETWEDTGSQTPSGTPIAEYSTLAECEGNIQYRWSVVSGGYECSGTTKMTQEKKQQSTDGGETWTDVTPAETRAALPVIEYNSPDCGYEVCDCDSFAFSGTEEVDTNYITVKVKNNTGNAIYVDHVELYYANGDYDDEHDFGSVECDGSSATTTLTDEFNVMAGLPQTVTGATIDVCHSPQCSSPASETVTFNPDTLTNEGDIITLTFNG